MAYAAFCAYASFVHKVPSGGILQLKHTLLTSVYLGVHLDKNLDWNKGQSKLYLLGRLRYFQSSTMNDPED